MKHHYRKSLPAAKTATLVIAAACGLLSAQADDFAYSTMVNGDFGTIDLNTGAFTLLGNSGRAISGLGEAGGKLYATSFVDGTGTLYTVNPANGSLTTVGTAPINYAAIGSTSTGLYALGYSGGTFSLYDVNPQTGAGNYIGDLSAGAYSSYWQISAGGDTLYYNVAGALYTVNTSTAALTLVGEMGYQSDATVYEDGTLYVGEVTGGKSVNVLNPATAAYTSYAPLTGSTETFYGFAPDPIPTPEPTSLALAGLGGLGLLLGRRLRK